MEIQYMHMNIFISWMSYMIARKMRYESYNNTHVTLFSKKCIQERLASSAARENPSRRLSSGLRSDRLEDRVQGEPMHCCYAEELDPSVVYSGLRPDRVGLLQCRLRWKRWKLSKP